MTDGTQRVHSSRDNKISPGDLVTLSRDVRDALTIWKGTRGVEEAGMVAPREVGIVLARVHSLNGVPGTQTDNLFVLFGVKLGWSSAHWFARV